MHLFKCAITILLECYCAFLFSQTTTYSREFDANSKHIPLKILNCNSNYFIVLRYNKTIHDFIVEKRKKSNFEIASICPLKLDSVNANWFDYEKMDYLFLKLIRPPILFSKRCSIKSGQFISNELIVWVKVQALKNWQVSKTTKQQMI